MCGEIWDKLFSQDVINGQNGLQTLTQNFQLSAYIKSLDKHLQEEEITRCKCSRDIDEPFHPAVLF